jgi:hypothetical protein
VVETLGRIGRFAARTAATSRSGNSAGASANVTIASRPSIVTIEPAFGT